VIAAGTFCSPLSFVNFCECGLMKHPYRAEGVLRLLRLLSEVPAYPEIFPTFHANFY